MCIAYVDYLYLLLSQIPHLDPLCCFTAALCLFLADQSVGLSSTSNSQ